MESPVCKQQKMKALTTELLELVVLKGFKASFFNSIQSPRDQRLIFIRRNLLKMVNTKKKKKDYRFDFPVCRFFFYKITVSGLAIFYFHYLIIHKESNVVSNH